MRRTAAATACEDGLFAGLCKLFSLLFLRLAVSSAHKGMLDAVPCLCGNLYSGKMESAALAPGLQVGRGRR